ncbi:hypothetical protein [Pseudomonas frederiksbergensis]|uniref:Uncharacterized protein n=1 Tax=Pseudomonas frederiksbergensis TaxID=104087 RepID=A0A423KPV5_9PSED|nr:hypothetical protein [Pseudomonas frederiksbergensis]RON56666.1 hypothetical protein BK665_07070 [Pseudomonas frederiksbergensis]
MKIENNVNKKIAGSLEVKFTHQDYGEHELKLEEEGLFSRDSEFFYISPKDREVGGHSYYMGIKFRTGLEVETTYTLKRNDDSVRAHLEIDRVDGDKYASGTFSLSAGMPYPAGEFELFEEGVFKAKGKFKSVA